MTGLNITMTTAPTVASYIGRRALGNQTSFPIAHLVCVGNDEGYVLRNMAATDETFTKQGTVDFVAGGVGHAFSDNAIDLGVTIGAADADDYTVIGVAYGNDTHLDVATLGTLAANRSAGQAGLRIVVNGSAEWSAVQATTTGTVSRSATVADVTDPSAVCVRRWQAHPTNNRSFRIDTFYQGVGDATDSQEQNNIADAFATLEGGTLRAFGTPGNSPDTGDIYGYELMVFSTAITDAEMNAHVADMRAFWGALGVTF
jgi:hypothetical protein